MKKIFSPRFLWMILIIHLSLNIKAQNPTYLCELRNDVQTSSTVFEFDIYLLRTGSTAFEYAAGQFGILINPSVKSGGTITASIVSGSTDAALVTANQNPTSITFINGSNCIAVAGRALPGAGNGAIILNSTPGTRVCRVRLTNNVPFGQFQPNLTWTTTTIYPTQIYAYVGGSNVSIMDPASQTTSNLANKIMNQTPTPFDVTGGGSYCAGSGGLPVGLTGSENGVTYTLYKNGSATSTVGGTGSPITFGNQLFGTYTVSGTNGGGTTNMTGSAILTENATPVAPTVGVVNNCNGTSTLTASGYTGTLLWSNSATTPSITVSTAGTYTVTQTVSGCTSSAGSGTAAPKTTPGAPTVGVVNNCNGTSTLTASGYTGTLLWSTSATTSSIIVNSAGTYTVTQTVNGCTSPAGSGIAAPKTTPVAPGVSVVDNCGTSILTATGFTGTLLWSTSATTTSITVNTPGVYTVTQTVNGCTSLTGSGTAAPKSTPPAPTVIVVDNCNGTSTLTASGFTGTLLWSTSATTASITVNAAGTYTVTQTVSGCTSLAGSGTAAPKTTPVAPTVTVVDNCNGTSTLTASGFTGTLLWSTSATTASIIVNAAGTYTVTQTVGGCTSLAGSGTAAPKTAPAAPTVVLTQPTCLVGTGTITITAPTGAGMTFSIDGLTYTNSTGIFTLVTPGLYTVTAKNAAGCISTGTSATISAQPPTPVVPAQTTSATSGVLFVFNPIGGTIPPGTTYTWTAPTYTNGVTGGSAQFIPQANINGTLTIPSGVGTALYTVTPTSGVCVGATFTVTVTVTSTCTGVTVGTQPADIAMCAVSGIATFTVAANGTAPFTYQWQYNNGVTWGSVANGTPVGAVYTNATTPILSVTGISTSGSYQYRCSVSNCGGGNTANSNTATLTVNALPVITLTSSIPGNTFCLGTSVIFTASGGTNYDFRVNGASRQNGPTTTYTTSSLANGQIVTVVVTGANGCTATSAGITNIVNQPPYIVGTPTATCATDFLTYSVVLTVSTGTVTSTSGIVTNTLGNTWTISVIPAGVNVNLTITDLNGCQLTQPINAPNCLCPVVLPPVSGGNRSYCAGGIIPALTATAQSGEIVEWYSSSSGGTPIATGTSFTPTTQGTYYAQAKNLGSNCVSTTRTIIILTMNPLPTPTLVSSDADNIFCGGTSVTFTATGGTNYNFLVGGTTRQDGLSAIYTTNLLTNGQAVNVVVTNTFGCIATAGPITNTVNPTPIPTLTSSDADNSFCAGTNVTFTAGGGTNYNFRVGGVSVQNGVLTTYSNNSLTNGQVVDVVVSNTSGCPATSAAITNSVFAAPTANAGTGGNNCGLGFTLNGSLNVGTGTWSKVSGPGSVSFSPNANTPTAVATVSSFGTYVFSWTVANGTCTSSANVTVIFIQQPPAEAGTGGDECDKDFILKAVITTGVGTWTKISGPGTAVFTPDSHQANAKVTVDQFGTYNFGWTVVNSICTSSDVVRVVFHDLPPVNAGRDTAFCKGGSVQLLAQGVGTVSWVPAAPALISNPNIINPVATPDTTTTYTVNLTDQFGCKNSDNIVVEVRVKPVANAGPDQELTYVLKTTMDATLAHSYETGVWSLVRNSGTGEFSDSTYSKTEVSNLSLGKNKFLWKVKNGYCTPSSDTVMITVNNFIVPTLITPNMDGRNDYFVLRGIATLGKTELIIFDRRGTQVYRNANYDNSWNGVDYNKNPLPSDTYFYVIKSENGISISGYIVIRR
jgi:gliding motility-associated-like protein